MADGGARVKELVEMRNHLAGVWPRVKCTQPCTDRDVSNLVVGDSFGVSSKVYLDGLKPVEAEVEICYGPVGTQNKILESRFAKMLPSGDSHDGWQEYSCRLTCQTSGRHGFTARVVPRGSNWKNVMPGYINWADASGSAGNDRTGAVSLAGVKS
jgi:starch phosphorylase